jgi:DNA-binding beta-propeller fold protein YncE
MPAKTDTLRPVWLTPLVLVLVGCGSSPAGGGPGGGACADGGAADADPRAFSTVAISCAYSCPLACPEATTPYACQNLAPWGCVPHEDACPAWDGVTYPKVVAGQCTASLPSADAMKYAGADPDHAGVRVLPDGRRIAPAGSEWIFSEPDLSGGLTTAVLAIAGTNLVLTVDSGPGDHAVRAIDATKIGGVASPVVSYVKFAAPSTLNSGIAFVAPDLVLVATDDGDVQALKLDTTSGTLTRDDARSIPLPSSVDANGNTIAWYASGVAASPDGKKVVVTGVTQHNALVCDVAAGSPTFGQILGQVDLGAGETFAAAFDPADAAGQFVYVSMWGSAEVVELDVSVPAAPKLTRTFKTDKDPEGMAFLDGRWMAVANDFGETIGLIDRTAGTISSVPIEPAGQLNGFEPSGLAFDATSKRLYAALAGGNAVAAYDVDLTLTPPGVTPHGRLPTSWWPGGVATLADGSVVVASMRGHGSGGTLTHFDLGNSDISDRMRGGIQRIPTPSAADLDAGEAVMKASLAVGALSGAPTVSCPAGASDFPVPATNTEGPSKSIDHAFLIVRENKDFDSLFGDFPNVEGRPDLTLKTAPGQMDRIWTNLRTLARTFTLSDNYYTDAVYSTQGHVWATYGRSSDFDERTWAISGSGRNARSIPGAGIIDVGEPTEGSLFDWLGTNGVPYDILGEIVGEPQNPPTMHPPVDGKYPGGPFQNIGHDDDEKACHIAARSRIQCDFGQFVYATLPNDHTFGVAPTNPAPETFCAVNDEATGMAVDAITHSPLWASSVIFITEDDPSQGGEHIDSHRAPLVVISPWVKRGYVSKTHIDMGSLHKLFAHVFGKPYPNFSVANSGLPLDMFTSTPDYTPYTYAPRSFPLVCGDGSTQAEQTLTQSWDFAMPDEQPGLEAQVRRWMRGEQLKELSPTMKRQIELRLLRRASALPRAVGAAAGPAEHD